MLPALRVHGLQVAFGSRLILRNLSFEVAPGEFFIVIGPNSAGKTTLLKTLAGIVRPQKGQVEIFGRPLQSYARRELARLLAVMPQRPESGIPFTAVEAVLLGRSPHLGWFAWEKSRDLELAREAMALTHVSHLADRPLSQLSGGELQRVVLARALCQEPRLLLLDEPTAALDLRHQVRVMDLLSRLRRERNLTVVMVSHDLNLAAMYGDRLLLLKEGRILSLGTPQEVLTYEQLEAAYGCVLLVDDNPLGGVPRITLVPEKYLPPLSPEKQERGSGLRQNPQGPEEAVGGRPSEPQP